MSKKKQLSFGPVRFQNILTPGSPGYIPLLLDPAMIGPQNRWVKESELHAAFPQSLLALPEFILFQLRGP